MKILVAKKGTWSANFRIKGRKWRTFFRKK